MESDFRVKLIQSCLLPDVKRLGKFVEQRKTGETIEYIVQTVPPESVEDVVELFTKFFLPREPIHRSHTAQCPAFITGCQDLFREGMQCGTTMLALDVTNGEKPKLIGANITPIVTMASPLEEDEKENEDSEVDSLFAPFDEFERIEMRNIVDKYGVVEYMTSYGLTVDPGYSGFKVGQRLLECRRVLCQVLDVKATGNWFTVPSSQHIARKIGFETLAEIDCATYTMNGKTVLAHVPLEGKLKLMTMKF